jgi:KaiC/GvpD/RAD55 family RecA-like ATPase
MVVWHKVYPNLLLFYSTGNEPSHNMEARVDRRIPTGIGSLDPVLDGGVPPGSMVLLLSEIGAGGSDFVRTAAIALARTKQEGKSPAPREVLYITMTRLKEDVLAEAALSVSPDMYPLLEEGVHFEDLSEVYFDASVVPPEWYSQGDVLSRMQRHTRRESLLTELSVVLSGAEAQSVIIIDSLTDLAAQAGTGDRWEAFSGFLRGLQRVAKRWGSVIYLPLTRGVLPPLQETEIQDCADAVFLFAWEETQGMRRQRTMSIQKFRGVMPHLEERNLVKFAIRITAGTGFEVSNIRVVI